jgi:hypothetical protein
MIKSNSTTTDVLRNILECWILRLRRRSRHHIHRSLCPSLENDLYETTRGARTSSRPGTTGRL